MTVLVLERRPRWVPELRRALADEQTPIRACRALDDLTDAAARSAEPCVVVLDLAEFPGDGLRWLGSFKPGDRRPAVIVSAGGATAELEWIARDLGASAVLLESATAQELAAICRRLLRAARP